MTETEWKTSRKPGDLLGFMRLRASDRKLRLFGCGCCRLFLENIQGTWARQAVEAAEKYADDQITEEAMDRIRRQSHQALRPLHGAEARLGWAVAQLLKPGFTWTTAASVARLAWTGRVGHYLPDLQCAFIRDLFGNPFRRPGSHVSSFQGQDKPTELARMIYHEKRFDLLPSLGDALAEAGCGDEAILRHCYLDEGHTPGCWVLDWLLAKD